MQTHWTDAFVKAPPPPVKQTLEGFASASHAWASCDDGVALAWLACWDARSEPSRREGQSACLRACGAADKKYFEQQQELGRTGSYIPINDPVLAARHDALSSLVAAMNGSDEQNDSSSFIRDSARAAYDAERSAMNRMIAEVIRESHPNAYAGSPSPSGASR